MKPFPREAVCLAVLLSGAATVAACGGSRQETVVDPRGPAGQRLRMLSVPSSVAVGLSGATVDEDGGIWLIPEERRVLVRLDPASGATRTVPLRGVDEDMDAEAIAWLGEGRFAVGTETTDADRIADPVLFVELEGGQARVDNAVRCPYELWQIEAESNEGIEGLCYADGRLVLALELVGESEGDHRWAPLATYDIDSERWTRYRLWLTSERGKISALACRPADGGAMEVLAVERHFEVSRLLRLSLPPRRADVSPEPMVDLGELTSSDANFEGLAWLASGEVAVVQDNHYGELTSSSSAIVVLPPGLVGD